MSKCGRCGSPNHIRAFCLAEEQFEYREVLENTSKWYWRFFAFFVAASIIVSILYGMVKVLEFLKLI